MVEPSVFKPHWEKFLRITIAKYCILRYLEFCLSDLRFCPVNKSVCVCVFHVGEMLLFTSECIKMCSVSDRALRNSSGSYNTRGIDKGKVTRKEKVK